MFIVIDGRKFMLPNIAPTDKGEMNQNIRNK